MKTFLRLVAASGLAGLLLAPPGFAESQLPEPLSSTGAYLAGQQALQELRTPDAARFLHDAAVDGWDNPTVLDRAYLAFAGFATGGWATVVGVYILMAALSERQRLRY